MLPAMHLSCSEMIKEWEMLTEGLDKICELDVQPYMEALTSDVISRTSFGSNYQEGRQIFELQSQLAQLTHQLIQSSYIPGWRCQVFATFYCLPYDNYSYVLVCDCPIFHVNVDFNLYIHHEGSYQQKPTRD